MSCYHPLHMYYDKFTEDGKEKHIFVDDNSVLPFIAPDGHVYTESRDVPCGQCIGCRLDRSREWALRCVLEASQHEHNLFVTLTYDDAHLPWNSQYQEELYGEIVTDEIPTLVKTDPSAFIKRLRARLKYNYDCDTLRVYYCGEYGDKTGRPHYHLILFGLPELPLKLRGRDKLGFPVYNCDLFDQCWKKGFAVVGEVTFESCAYVARYVMKKQTGDKADIYHRLCIVPEFVEMSRRPGIGKLWYDEFKYDKCYAKLKDDDTFDIIDGITWRSGKGKVLTHRPPRYFDKLFTYDDGYIMDEIKEARYESAKNRQFHILNSTSLSIEEYQSLKEGNHLNAIKILTRDEI